MDRFDLEQHILQCWEICDDIEMMVDQGADPADIACLSLVYRYKFKQLFETYTILVHDGQLTTKECKDEQE